MKVVSSSNNWISGFINLKIVKRHSFEGFLYFALITPEL